MDKIPFGIFTGELRKKPEYHSWSLHCRKKLKMSVFAYDAVTYRLLFDTVCADEFC